MKELDKTAHADVSIHVTFRTRYHLSKLEVLVTPPKRQPWLGAGGPSGILYHAVAFWVLMAWMNSLWKFVNLYTWFVDFSVQIAIIFTKKKKKKNLTNWIREEVLVSSQARPPPAQLEDLINSWARGKRRTLVHIHLTIMSWAVPHPPQIFVLGFSVLALGLSLSLLPRSCPLDPANTMSPQWVSMTPLHPPILCCPALQLDPCLRSSSRTCRLLNSVMPSRT